MFPTCRSATRHTSSKECCAGFQFIVFHCYRAVSFQVRKVTPDGIITTFAGTGVDGTSGDGGPATRAPLAYPIGVAVDSAGNVFIALGRNQIREVTPDGIIFTVAGNGKPGASGDGGPATSAAVAANSITVDALSQWMP